MNYTRIDRLKSILLKEVSNIIKNDCKDSFLEESMITIVDLTLPKDLSFARVYLTTLVEGRADKVVSILENQSGYIRKLLGQRLHLKKIPKLHFFKDATIESIERMNQLLYKIDPTE